jgi:hypothetical protein
MTGDLAIALQEAAQTLAKAIFLLEAALRFPGIPPEYAAMIRANMETLQGIFNDIKHHAARSGLKVVVGESPFSDGPHAIVSLVGDAPEERQ